MNKAFFLFIIAVAKNRCGSHIWSDACWRANCARLTEQAMDFARLTNGGPQPSEVLRPSGECVTRIGETLPPFTQGEI